MSVSADDPLVGSEPLRDRVRSTPVPAAVWVVGVLILLGLQAGRIGPGIASLGVELVTATSVAVAWIADGFGGPWWRRVAAGIVVATVGIVLNRLSGRSPVRWILAHARRLDSFPGARRLSRLDRAVDDLLVTVGLAGTGWLVVRSGLLGPVRTVGGAVQAGLTALDGVPTLPGRELVPNRGYQTPDGTWHGPFLGLSPAVAWGLRVLLVAVYVAAWLGWLGVGYRWYRRHYRRADWTPRDDVLRRLRGHRWGQFGMLVVAAFLAMALFAPTLGTTTAEQNIYSPFSNSIEYYDTDAGEVTELLVGQANLQTTSEGYPGRNVAPLSYDQYDRFHPFGTMTDGKDLFTFLMHGARVSLLIGLLSVAVSAALAMVFALISAYYRGLADLLLVVVGDTIMGVPRLLLLILLTVLLSDTWLAEIYDGGVLLALVLAGTGWPFLWRSFRGPALQTAERDWVDAARSYGQSPGGIMRLHLLPYLVGYLLIYSSLVLGGVILAIAGLSFLGLGITAPTPEWGRAVDLGREYVATQSWHISLIPGVMITLVVMAFNAVGDALRDAVDPQSDAGVTDASETESRGGGA